MSNFILTIIKEMNKLLTVPRFYGPLATVLLTVLYDLGSHYFGYSVTLIWVAIAVVIGSFIGGLRAGLVAALFAVGYAFYAIPMVDNINRAWQVSVGMLIIAGAVGYLRRRERRLQQAFTMVFANGNVTKIRSAKATATAGKQEAGSPAARIRFEQIESDLGNTLAILDGYKFLREEIERVNQWYADPKNAERLKRMEREK